METFVLAFGFSPGLPEMVILGAIALLLFGKRLPEVARSLGKGIVEFKKGVSGIEDDVDKSTFQNNVEASRPAPKDEPEPVATSAPKFTPPESAPTDAESTSKDF